VRSSWAVPSGVSAVAKLDGKALIVGLEDGRLEWVGAGPGARGFGDVDASAVRRILRGPKGLIVVGYASGMIGFWSSEGGGRLEHAHLHGAIELLALSDNQLYAASELGDSWVSDLGIFSQPYCKTTRRRLAAGAR
jgi:hypothetical protein